MVIPAKAGIQSFQWLRRSDEIAPFCEAITLGIARAAQALASRFALSFL
jgi:hypothetical protein